MYVSDVCIVGSPGIGQGSLACLWIPLPHLDAVIGRCGEDASAVEIDVDHGDAILVAILGIGLKFFNSGHGWWLWRDGKEGKKTREETGSTLLYSVFIGQCAVENV